MQFPHIKFDIKVLDKSKRADRRPPSPSSEDAVKDTHMFQRITDRLRRLGSSSGQDLIEYALLVALIVIVVIAAVSPVGLTIKTVFWDAIAITYGSI